MLKLLATIIIPVAAIAAPVLLALLSYYVERRRERANVERSLRTEMGRIRALLSARLAWLESERMRDLPLLPFETPLYDAQVSKLGTCDASFAAIAVSFYGIVHFLNAFVSTRDAYARSGDEHSYFHAYAKAARRALMRYAELERCDR